MTKRIHSRLPTDCELPEPLDFVGLHFDDKGYRIHVAEFANADGDIFEINFGDKSLAQRSMDEGSYLALAWEIDKDDPPSFGHLALVRGSDFLDWFVEQSCGVYRGVDVKHVAIFTMNEWIEVLCRELPTIRKLTS